MEGENRVKAGVGGQGSGEPQNFEQRMSNVEGR